MNMPGWTKLFSTLVTSTVWREDDKTRIVWITMLAMATPKGDVEASIPGLAAFANVSVQECESALEKLQSPDRYSRTKDANEGRRIVAIDGGYRLLNYTKYRELGRSVDRREYLAEKQRESRSRRSQPSQPIGQPVSTDVSLSEKEKSEEEIGSQIAQRQADLSLAPSPSTDKVLLTFPTDGSPKAWDLTKSRVVKLRDAYPSLDIAAQSKMALAWIESNPAKRKTADGMPKFLNGWMSRAQNDGRAAAPAAPSSRTSRPPQPVSPGYEERNAEWKKKYG